MKTTLSIAEEQALKITYGALVFVVGGIVAFTIWITTMQIAVTANAQTVQELSVNTNEMFKVLISIDKRLDRIEQLLKPKQGE